MRLTGAISPSISANTNDWAPTDFATCEVIRLTSTGSYDLTGIAGGSKGRMIALFVISGTVTLINASASSAVGNRFDIGTAVTLGPGYGATLLYDHTSGVWRLLRSCPTSSAPLS